LLVLDPKTKALLSLGFLKPQDGFFLAINIICFWAGASWCIFGNPAVWQLIGLAIFMILANQAWILLVAYRVCLFILEARADINMLPETVATIMLDRSKANVAV